MFYFSESPEVKSFPKVATQDVALTYAMGTFEYILKNLSSSKVTKLSEIKIQPPVTKII